jgi:hypothetical protein
MGFQFTATLINAIAAPAVWKDQRTRPLAASHRPRLRLIDRQRCGEQGRHQSPAISEAPRLSDPLSHATRSRRLKSMAQNPSIFTNCGRRHSRQIWLFASHRPPLWDSSRQIWLFASHRPPLWDSEKKSYSPQGHLKLSVVSSVVPN